MGDGESERNRERANRRRSGSWGASINRSNNDNSGGEGERGSQVCSDTENDTLKRSGSPLGGGIRGHPINGSLPRSHSLAPTRSLVSTTPSQLRERETRDLPVAVRSSGQSRTYYQLAGIDPSTILKMNEIIMNLIPNSKWRCVLV